MRRVLKIAGIIIGIMLIGVFILNTFMVPNDFSKCDLETLVSCRSDAATGIISTAGDCDADQYQSNCQEADAIVVISGGDTRARTEYGVKLYKAGLAPTLILSGAAYQSGVPSNAEEMAQIAVDLGVFQNDVLVETESRNTYQNAEFVKGALESFGYKSIILVTSGYHQRRASVEFNKFLGKEFKIYDAPVPKDKDWSPYWFLTPRGWYLAIKESAGLILASSGASQ